jgi:Uma2 family endonuclease
MYQESGVQVVWVVDPDLETIAVIERDRPTVVPNSSDGLSGGEILPGFSVTVAEIFAEE